ncbi:MAG: VapC toxin family PIN domain ribonuclease [Candidatus Riflebacteria bacterium HGW-Riflebacteria-1]|jgi:tRNA(fMet)-specific endonuclease VapC|nr:MAG: VapC toxin family PIN domain ribonuclease [Candidatus Riflebacteria bacterium HGW-Riflebacteria-1]
MYCLDTNTCIYFLNGKHESVKRRLLSLPPIEIAIPAVVKAELLLGAYKSRNLQKNTEIVERFLEPFEILPFSDQVTYVYADLRAVIEKKGEIIGPNDLMIAAIAQFFAAILVTNNLKEFSRIKSLKTENWVKS